MRRRAAAIAVALGVVGSIPAPHAASAANGRFLLFSAYGDNTPYHVFKIRLDGTGLRKLSGGRGGTTPSWSSDGRRIAYSSHRGIVIIRADGTRRRAVAKNGSSAQWSPDDSHLVVSRYCCIEDPTGSSIFVIRPDGGRKRVLARTGFRWAVGSAAWAPTDRRIAYTRSAVQCPLDGCPRSQLKVVSQWRNNRETLVRRHGIRTFDWSPDGTRVVFACRCGRDQEDLFVVHVRSKEVTRITRTAAFESDPAWSPDGDRIVAVKWSADGTGRNNLVTMDPDGSSEVVIATRLRGGGPSPSWAPNGDRIVFLRGERSEVFVMNEDGTNQTQVTNDRRDQVDPSWQPR